MEAITEISGIVSQSVKDVVQSLVDDDLVDSDKIGTSIYFWAFPSKATSIRKRKLESLHDKLDDSNKRLKSSEASLEDAIQGREESEDRKALLKELDALKVKKANLETEIKKYKDCDPQVIEDLKSGIKLCHQSANRWTDNIFALHSWIQNKFPSININDLNKQFGIPDDIDYVE